VDEELVGEELVGEEFVDEELEDEEEEDTTKMHRMCNLILSSRHPLHRNLRILVPRFNLLHIHSRPNQQHRILGVARHAIIIVHIISKKFWKTFKSK